MIKIHFYAQSKKLTDQNFSFIEFKNFKIKNWYEKYW
jgi:hypothetical protein